MKIFKSLAVFVASVLALAPLPASAAIILPISFTYSSGGGFDGTITMNDSLTQLLGVSGVSNGYSTYSTTYVAGTSSTYSEVLYNGTRAPWDPAPSSGTTFVGYIANTPWMGNPIRLIIDFSSPDAPVLLSSYDGYGWLSSGMTWNPSNTITGGTVTNPNAAIDAVGAVPEPSMWVILLLGFGSLAVALRSNRRLQRLQGSASA